MVVGALFILTLTTFIAGPEDITRFLIGYFTFIIITPFLISAFIILKIKNRTLEFAKTMTLIGFTTFGVYLALILAFQLVYMPPTLIEDIEQQCVKSPGTFNVTTDLWKCSKFNSGSLAERCAKNPGYFNVTRSDCADFIPPSN